MLLTIILTIASNLTPIDLQYVQKCKLIGGISYNADTNTCLTETEWTDGVSSWTQQDSYKNEEISAQVPNC